MAWVSNDFCWNGHHCLPIIPRIISLPNYSNLHAYSFLASTRGYLGKEHEDVDKQKWQDDLGWNLQPTYQNSNDKQSDEQVIKGKQGTRGIF